MPPALFLLTSVISTCCPNVPAITFPSFLQNPSWMSPPLGSHPSFSPFLLVSPALSPAMCLSQDLCLLPISPKVSEIPIGRNVSILFALPELAQCRDQSRHLINIQ